MRGVAAAFLVLVSLARAQQPTTTGSSRELSIEVTALDRDGRPVSDLTAADFVLELNGRPQPVRSATLLRGSRAMAGAVGPVFGAVTPGPPPYRLVFDAPDDAKAGAELAVRLRSQREGVSVFATDHVRVTAAPAVAARSTPAPVLTRLQKIGPLTTNGLKFWIVDIAGAQHPLVEGAVPPDAARLLVVLELRPAADAPDDLLVKMSLAPESNTQSSELERVITPEVSDGVLVAEAEFVLARMAPGAYVVRATVLAGNRELGSLSSAIKR